MLHIGRNILSLLTSRVLSAIILLLIYFRLLDYLGPEATGQYGLQAAYLTIFAFFVDLGIQQLVIKKISENREEASKYLSNYFGIQLLLGLGFAVIMTAIVLSAHYPSVVERALFATATGMFLSSMTMPFMAVINAFERFKVIAVVNFINAMINAGMMIIAFTTHRGVIFLAFIPVIISLFDILVYGYIVEKKFARFRLRFDYEFWKQLMILALPFIPLTIFSIYNRIDTLLLPHLRNFTETGYYTTAYKFWDMLAFVPGALGAVLYPYFANKIYHKNLAEAKKVLEIYTRIMIAMAVPLTVGAYLIADKLLAVLIRDASFAPAAPAVWILIAAGSLLMIYIPVNVIMVSQRTKTATKITFITLVFNLSANLILVPKYGFIMAAKITFFSELIQLLGYTYIVKTQIINFTYFSNFIKPITAGIIMGSVVYVFRDSNFFLILAIGGLVYVTSLLLLRFFEKEEWQLFKDTINIRKKVELP
ncbi:MAG: flippase [Candidatus Doudnabacteria bacterium]|nr:flippase [Candidatus Doudnabacteria bacterium]